MYFCVSLRVGEDSLTIKLLHFADSLTKMALQFIEMTLRYVDLINNSDNHMTNETTIQFIRRVKSQKRPIEGSLESLLDRVGNLPYVQQAFQSFETSSTTRKPVLSEDVIAIVNNVGKSDHQLRDSISNAVSRNTNSLPSNQLVRRASAINTIAKDGVQRHTMRPLNSHSIKYSEPPLDQAANVATMKAQRPSISSYYQASAREGSNLTMIIPY